MAVGDQDVLPAVVIEIKKFNAEGEIRDANWAEACRAGEIGELAVVIVVVEVVAVVGEIRLNDVGPAIVVVVGGVNAHAGLLFAVGAVAGASFNANLSESTFAVVVVKHAGR